MGCGTRDTRGCIAFPHPAAGLTGVVKYDNINLVSRDTRPISWVKAARKDFEKFPDGAQTEILRALTIAAEGRKAEIELIRHRLKRLKEILR